MNLHVASFINYKEENFKEYAKKNLNCVYISLSIPVYIFLLMRFIGCILWGQFQLVNKNICVVRYPYSASLLLCQW